MSQPAFRNRFFLIGSRWILGCMLCASVGAAQASFVVYGTCMSEAGNKSGFFARSAAGLDCGLALAKEIKEAIPGFTYLPTIDPRDSFGVSRGSTVTAHLLLLDPGPAYVVGSGLDFDTLLLGNTFAGATTIADAEVRVIDIGLFATFAEAADIAEASGDLSVAFENALWNDGVVLHAGGSNIQLDTGALVPGMYAARVRLTDVANGGTVFGLGVVQIVAEPGSLGLVALALCAITAGLHRGRRGFRRSQSARVRDCTDADDPGVCVRC